MRWKRSIILTALIVALVAVNWMQVMGSDDNIGFHFTISPVQSASHNATARYRQTKDTSNPWKVKMTISGEGDGTITVYSLEKASTGNRVAPEVYVTQGLGPYYPTAYEKANQTNVYLQGRNNNYNGNSYGVYGIWDEETWD